MYDGNCATCKKEKEKRIIDTLYKIKSNDSKNNVLLVVLSTLKHMAEKKLS
jgi:hypothetical protein